MSIGTRSLLYGSHQFILHPLMVLVAWRELYGALPRDWRVWVAIVAHDWGYWGLRDMDGAEGDTHPDRSARLIEGWFPDRPDLAELVRYHSRFAAKRDGRNVSRLCAPDKLACALWWPWLYVLLCSWTGELDEYIARNRSATDKYAATTGGGIEGETRIAFYRNVAAYLRRWAYEHANGRYDTWTQGAIALAPVGEHPNAQ